MFNLIVGSGLSNGRSGSISASRVLEYTEQDIEARFLSEGKLDVTAVSAIPTLFMDEGKADEIAGVGWLTRIELRGRDYQLRYALDPEIPRITNANIYTLASDLNIHDWEYARTHWSIKDVDLFQIFFKQKLAQRPAPTVFQLSKNPVNPRLISMMMPFSSAFSRVHQSVKTAIEAKDYECRRADDFWLHAHIMHDIIELICTSKVVICDLSGKNPNVFYEAGIAHTLGKEVILITQNIDDVPFDLRALRCIIYLNNQQGCEQLANEVVARLQTVA